MSLRIRIGGITTGSGGGGIPIQPEYLTVKAAMTTPPSASDAVIQNRWVYDLKQAGAWDKAILLDNFSCPTEQSSLLNWKAPGTTNPSKNNSPTFTAYKGFTGIVSGIHMLKTNFTPSVDGAGFLGQDDITIIVGINTELSENKIDFSSYTNTTKGIYANTNFNGFYYFKINSDVQIQGVSTLSKRYFTLSRNSGSTATYYKNLVKRTVASTSTGLCDTAIWACGSPQNAVSLKVPSFILIFKFLTETETQAVIVACDNYLSNYNTNIMSFQRNVNLNLVLEGHSFIYSTTLLEDNIQAKINISSGYNVGAAGSTIAHCVTRQATTDGYLITETSKYKNILGLFIGLNNIVNTAGEGSTAYTALKSYVQSRITSGWKVLIYTMTPSTGGGRGAQFEIERNIYNGLIRSDLALINGVYVLDTDTISELNDPTNTTYYNLDHIHPALAGALLLGSLFSDKIEQIYG